MSLRPLQARLLVRPLWRARAWSLPPLAGLLVLAVSVAFQAAGRTPHAAAVGLAAAVLLAGATAYAADDASADLVAPAPAPLAFRGAVRLGGAVVLATACWAVLLAYVAAVHDGVALARPTLMVATVVAMALFAGLAWGGVAGGPAAVAFVGVAATVPDRWSLVDPGAAAGRRLAAVLVAAVLAIAWRLRDPARR